MYDVQVTSGHKASVDLEVDKNDNMIDLKFLLAEKVGTQPEYIQIIKNLKTRIFSNSSSLISCGLLKSNSVAVNYWLEMPQNDSAKPNEFVIRSQPNLLEIPSFMDNVGKCFRYFAQKYPHNAHLGVYIYTLSLSLSQIRPICEFQKFVNIGFRLFSQYFFDGDYGQKKCIGF